MKESSTYQAILEQGRQQGRQEGRQEGQTEGAVAEAKKMLRLFADDAFGPPAAKIATAIDQIDDLRRLEELVKRVRSANSWDELLGKPGPARRRGGNKSR